MANYLNLLLNPLPNAVLSGFMLVLLLYWIVSFIGVSLDDIGIESDTDLETEIDA